MTSAAGVTVSSYAALGGQLSQLALKDVLATASEAALSLSLRHFLCERELHLGEIALSLPGVECR